MHLIEKKREWECFIVKNASLIDCEYVNRE